MLRVSLFRMSAVGLVLTLLGAIVLTCSDNLIGFLIGVMLVVAGVGRMLVNAQSRQSDES